LWVKGLSFPNYGCLAYVDIGGTSH